MMENDMAQNIYEGATIQDIRYGYERDRGDILYAILVDKDGELLISATLDYIVGTLKVHLKPNP